MKEHMKAYKERLEKGICEYMDGPISERSATAIHMMFKALRDVERRLNNACEFTMEDAKNWADGLVNADGATPAENTHGAHWDIATTTAVAEANGIMMDHIYPYDFWIALNMIYSDYCEVARKFGVDTVEFYVEMAKAFLFDADGPGPVEKLGAYYHSIVCPDMY